MGFEPMITVFERAKTFRVSEGAATVITKKILILYILKAAAWCRTGKTEV
jgi:hypothetical protein